MRKLFQDGWGIVGYVLLGYLAGAAVGGGLLYGIALLIGASQYRELMLGIGFYVGGLVGSISGAVQGERKTRSG